MDQDLLGVAQQGGGIGAMMLPIALMFGVFYLLVIRPQSKQRKAHEKMLTELKKGDKIVTNGGVLGEISGIKDQVVTVLISDKVRIRVLRNQIAGHESKFTQTAS